MMAVSVVRSCDRCAGEMGTEVFSTADANALTALAVPPRAPAFELRHITLLGNEKTIRFVDLCEQCAATLWNLGESADKISRPYRRGSKTAPDLGPSLVDATTTNEGESHA